MAIARDTFVETSDTALGSHTPTGTDAGAGWNVHIGAMQVIAATDLVQDNNISIGNRANMTTNIGTEDMTVSLDVSFTAPVTAGDSIFSGPTARAPSASAVAAVEFAYDWGLGAWTCGTSSVTEAWPGGSVNMKVVCVGDTIYCYANGVLKITNTENLGRGNTYSGIVLGNFQNDTTRRAQGDNFLAGPSKVPRVERVSAAAGSTGASVTTFFTGTPTVGNRIVVTSNSYDNVTFSWTSEVDDATGGSNTYTEHVDRSEQATGGSSYGGVMIASASIDRTKSGLGVTVTPSTTSGVNAIAYEVSGLSASPVDVVVSEADSGLTTKNISTGALANPNEFVVAALNFNANAGGDHALALNWSGATTGYINDGASPPLAGEYGASAYKVVSSGAGETIEWTHTADSNRICSIAAVTFKAVGINGTGNLVGPGALLSGTAARFSLPVFTVQPTAQTGAAGSTATFTATATATPSPTYQWFVDNGKGLGFETISGATSSSYTTPTLFRAIHAGQIYKVVATNGAGAVNSNIVLLSVTDIPTSYYNCGMLVGNGFVGECQIGGSMTPALHTSAGPITGPGSLVIGSATKTATHTTTGALVGPGTLVTGSAARATVVTTHTTTGTLVGSGALVTGSAARTRVHATTGALIGQDSLVAGSAARTRVHATTGALIGQGSLVAGSAARTRVHATTGALIGQGSLVAGNATNVTRPIAYRNSAFATGVNSIINDKPTGVVENDVMYALLFTQYDTFHATCTGWNEVAHGTTSSSAFGVTVLRKVAGNSEPTTYTFTVDGNSESMIWAYRGVDNSTPEDVAVTIAAGTGATINFPSITTVTDKAVHLALIANYNNLPTNPSGYVNLPDSTRWLTAATFTKATAGTISGITGGSGDEWVAVSIAMRPAVHATTGNLVGQGSEITGSATRVSGSTAHATTGTLTGQGSLVTGTVARFRAMATSGALVGQGSLVTGSAVYNAKHATSGALTGQGSLVTGTAARFRAMVTSGALVGQGSLVTGSAVYNAKHATSGALTGQGSLVTGTAARFRAMVTSGALVGQGSLVTGSAARFRAMATFGTLIGQGSLVTGSAVYNAKHATSGVLVGQGSLVIGAATRTGAAPNHATTGALIGQGSAITGTATRFRAMASIGTLVGQGSTVTGTAARFRAMTTSGALIGQGSTVTGISVHNIPHPTTGALVGQGSTVTGTIARFRAMATSGALVGQGSLVTGSATRTGAAPNHATTGVLVGQGSLVTGSAVYNAKHATSGALIGQGSTVTGTAARFRAMTTSGALIGQGSLVTGTAARFRAHNTVGSLTGQISILTGNANRFRTFAVSGDLVGAGSLISGSSAHKVLHTTSGQLLGLNSLIVGSVNKFRVFSSSGNLIGFSAIVGIANHPPKISDYTGEIFIKDNIVSYYYQSTLLDSFSTSDKIEYHYITMNDPVVSTTINPQYYYRSENTPIFITNSV